MGSSESKEHPGPGQQVEPCSQPPVRCPGVFRDTEPRIVLGNQSSYRISYWVFEEEKKHPRTKSSRYLLVSSMTQHLNGANPVDTTQPSAVSGGVKGNTVGSEEEGIYFLTRDHRMEPKGYTQATKITFPVDGEAMRVCAFFQASGRWQLFLDKVYSIGLFRMAFTFTALDAHIAPCIDSLANK